MQPASNIAAHFAHAQQHPSPTRYVVQGVGFKSLLLLVATTVAAQAHDLVLSLCLLLLLLLLLLVGLAMCPQTTLATRSDAASGHSRSVGCCCRLWSSVISSLCRQQHL
jgi:hypothetical protein